MLTVPGGLVADAGTFNLLLAHCTTVWLKAEPKDHMRRVTEQGDLRPMMESAEAMEDLRRILGVSTIRPIPAGTSTGSSPSTGQWLP